MIYFQEFFPRKFYNVWCGTYPRSVAARFENDGKQLFRPKQIFVQQNSWNSFLGFSTENERRTAHIVIIDVSDICIV